MKKRIFIYGVPGSGKTYFSEQLRCKTGYQLIEADALKEKVPIAFLGTCQAYQYFGERTRENVTKGLEAVRAAFRQVINDTISQHTGNFIMEGAFLDPKDLLKVGDGVVVLLVAESETQHRQQFFKHRTESGEAVDEFISARLVQEVLIDEAREHSIFILKSSNDTERMIEEVGNL